MTENNIKKHRNRTGIIKRLSGYVIKHWHLFVTAVIMALVSSYKNRPIDEKTIVFGEVGLSGEVRAVNMPEQRVAEARKLGFETCIIPEVSKNMVKGIKGIKVVGVKTIQEAIQLI